MYEEIVKIFYNKQMCDLLIIEYINMIKHYV